MASSTTSPVYDSPSGGVSPASPLLWFALGGSPAAFFINLNASYFLASWVCSGPGARALVLQGLSLFTLLLSAAAGVASWILYAQNGRRLPGENDDSSTRTRFVAVVALLASGFFSLIILAQWLGMLLMHPCPKPMKPDSPDAIRD